MRALHAVSTGVDEAEEALREEEERRRREVLEDSDLRFWEYRDELGMDAKQLELFTEKTCEVMSDEYGRVGVVPCAEGEWEYPNEEE